MSMRKPKFKPQVSRVKLNPEQAVLSRSCILNNLRVSGGSTVPPVVSNVCVYAFGVKGTHPTTQETSNGSASS